MFKTLQVRLYALALIIIIPCCFFIFLSFDYSRFIIKEELLKVSNLVSSDAAEKQSNLVHETQKLLEKLALNPALQDPDSEKCRAFVLEVSLLLNQYVNIGVPNNKGILTCNGSMLSKPINVWDRAYIQEAIKHKKFTASEVQIDRVIGHPTINFAYPIRQRLNQENILGAAVAVVSLQWWNKLLSESRLPDKSIAFILDQNGNPVASFPENQKYEHPKRFGTTSKGDDGINRVFFQHHSYDKNNEILLTFLTGIAIDESLTDVKNFYINMILYFFMIVVFVLILSHIYFIKTISNPLKALSTMANRLGGNEVIYAARPTGVKEMDSLQESFMDMAKLKSQAEQKNILQAKTDKLTGIPNRDAFNEKLASALLSAEKYNTKLGVMLLDLDNFKDINEVRGHEIGDEVLVKLSTLLKKHCPQANYIGRFGGDEFIFLFTCDEITPSYLTCIGDTIRTIVKQPLLVNNGTAYLSASLGIAIYPDDGKNLKELIGAADQAMYHSKEIGRDAVTRFNWDLKHALLERTQLTHDLRSAITNYDFHLVYQPIVNKFGEVTKFEALIRWPHPIRGLIPPDQFIPLAEETGQILEIGTWVIKEAKRALLELQNVYGDIQISVNTSPLQISKQLGSELCNLLTVAGESEYNGIVVEITENLLMNLDENTRKTLLNFRDKKIQIALDDFGTGYSSLSYIMNHDIDYLKIDKSFVDKIDNEFSSDSLCESIISMAHKLNIAVIAEGVENQTQMDLLLKYGCDYLQGYYFSKPISLEKALTYKQDKIFPYS